MKKFLAITAAVIIACLSCATAFAAGINSAEASVLSNMRAPANMKGNTVYVPSSYINQAEVHFNTIDMTSAQAGKINSIINQGRAYLQNTGKASIKELSTEERRTMMKYASDAAAVLNMSAAAGSDGKNIKVITKNGEVVVDDSTQVIKPTGSEVHFTIYITVLTIVGLLFVCGAAVILARKKNNIYEETK